MGIGRVCLLLGLAAAAPRSTAAAQAEPPRNGPFARVGLGIGNATSDAFSGPTEDASGILASAHAGFGGRRVQFVLAFDWQAFRIEDPGEYRGDPSSAGAGRFWYLLAGVQLFISPHVYLRPALGYAKSSWSGPGAAFQDTDHAAVGLAFGGEWRLWRRWFAAELGLQGAAAVAADGFTSTTRLLSARVMMPFY